MKKYLYHKKIENHYPLLKQGEEYYCEKDDFFDSIRIQLDSYKTTYYEIISELFEKHFISIKELRLQKLKKLSELCK